MVASARNSTDVDAPPETANVGLRVRELIAFASYYAAAQVDRVKLTAINIAMFVVLGAIAAFTGLTVVITASVLLVVGISQAIGAVLGGRMWAGYLITSVVVLGSLFVGTVVAFKIVTKSTRGKLVAAYEQRKHEQRSDLGTDVEQESRHQR